MPDNITHELLCPLDDETLKELMGRVAASEARAVISSELARRNGTITTLNGSSDSADDDPPSFPVDALPDPLRSLVREGAAASDIDPAFVALPLLGIAGGLIGPAVRLELKRGWVETAQQWLAVIAEPGRGKTPGEKHARHGGLDQLQAEAHQQYQREQEDYEAQVADWSRQPEGQRGSRPQPPQMISYYSADATMEALNGMLAIRPSLVVLRDELVSWVRSCDAYRGGRGGDRSAWLSLWSGVPVKVDRKSGKPIYITDPVVSVAGGIQPDMLPALAEEANRRDGFIDRMLFAFPDDHVPGWTEDEISDSTLWAVENQMQRLVRLTPLENPLRLSAPARETWVGWYRGNATDQRNVSGILGGIYAKLPIQLARLILLLHVLEEPSVTSLTPEVKPGTVARAIQLVEYFRAHAHRVVPYFGEAATTVPGLSPEQQRILDYHREYGPAPSSEVAEYLSRSRGSVNNSHQRLTKLGLLVRVSYGVYDLPSPPEGRTTSYVTDVTDVTDHRSNTGNTGNTGDTRSEMPGRSEYVKCPDCGARLIPGDECPICNEGDEVPF